MFSLVKTAAPTQRAEGFQEGATSVTSLTLYLLPSPDHGGTLRFDLPTLEGRPFFTYTSPPLLHVLRGANNTREARRGREKGSERERKKDGDSRFAKTFTCRMARAKIHTALTAIRE